MTRTSNRLPAAIIAVSLFVAAISLLLLSGCQVLQDIQSPVLNGNGVIRSQTRTIATFQGILIQANEIPFDVEVECSGQSTPRFEIIGDENLLSLVSQRVFRNVLSVSINTASPYRELRTTERMKLKIIAPSTIDRFELSGDHRAVITNVDTKNILLIGHQSQSITVSGRADSAVIRGLGATTEILAKNLLVQHSNTQLLSDAFAVVHAEKSLYATVRDAHIEYYGAPQMLFTSIQGTGNIVAKR
ncbi:MAG: DUF2807 domain-containing protein [Candidatus Kapabacteria bacterium]|jgi:hypothetical protein|nr:DUF2807 domain-containing protein [Candidatus Kapabacteria bacterium]